MKRIIAIVLTLVLGMATAASAANDPEWQYGPVDITNETTSDQPEFDIVDVTVTTYTRSRFTIWVNFAADPYGTQFYYNPDSFMLVYIDVDQDREGDYMLSFLDSETMDEGPENYEAYDIYDLYGESFVDGCNANRWLDGESIAFSFDVDCLPFSEVFGIQVVATDNAESDWGWDFYPDSESWTAFRTASYLGDKVALKVTFPKGKNTLSTSTKMKLLGGTWQVPPTSVTCVGYYATTSKKTLATKQAQAACNEVSRLVPTVNVKASASKGSSQMADAVTVTLKN